MRTAAWLAVSLVMAGCVVQPGDGSDEIEPTAVPPEPHVDPEPVELTKEDHCQMMQGPTVANGRLGVSCEFEAPEGVTRADVLLSWDNLAHNYGLEIDNPAGETLSVEGRTFPPSGELSLEFPPAMAGVYAFHPTAEGPVTPTTFDLNVVWTYIELLAPGETPERIEASGGAGDLKVERRADGWYATLTISARYASDPSPTRLRLNVDTVNGGAAIQGGSNVDVELTVWAKGGSENEARSNLEAIETRVVADGSEAVAVAHSTRPNMQWGASADVTVPRNAALSGVVDTTNGGIELKNVVADGLSADTTNGGIHFDRVRSSDLVADTTNGPIEGTIDARGTLSLDTTNGPIDVAINPTAALSLLADTTNAGIVLRLAEGSDIAYDLAASTTNGRISEDLNDADCEGDKDDCRLQTRNGTLRTVQVRGEVDTTNGDIEFTNE